MCKSDLRTGFIIGLLSVYLISCNLSDSTSVDVIELVQESKVFNDSVSNDDLEAITITWGMYTDLLQLKYPNQKIQWFSKKNENDENEYLVVFIAPGGIGQMWSVSIIENSIDHIFKNEEYILRLREFYRPNNSTQKENSTAGLNENKGNMERTAKVFIEERCQSDTGESWRVISKVLKGDFDADGKNDYAARVENKASKRSKIAVIHNQGSEIYWIEDLADESFSIMESNKMKEWLKTEVGDGITVYWEGGAHPVTFYFSKGENDYVSCQFCY